MNLNATLIGQIITFVLFTWVTMRFIWPNITQALSERQQKIADGLAAAERGQHDLVLAQQRASELLKQAKQNIHQLVEQAQKQAQKTVDAAKQEAQVQAQQQKHLAEVQIQHLLVKAKACLQRDLAALVFEATEALIKREFDPANRAANEAFISQCIERLS